MMKNQSFNAVDRAPVDDTNFSNAYLGRSFFALRVNFFAKRKKLCKKVNVNK